MKNSRTEWHQLHAEAPVDPDLAIIDAHHHIWPAGPLPYSPRYEPYEPADLFADKSLSGHKIIATVFVEARTRYSEDTRAHLRPVEKTAFAEQIALEATERGAPIAGVCAAIVAHADLLRSDRLEEVLDAHLEASPRRLRGIRHMTAWNPHL